MLQSWAGPSIFPLFMTAFPLLGVDVPPSGSALTSEPIPGDFAAPPAPADPLNSTSQSIFVGDEVINSHPRFRTLTDNIRRYRFLTAAAFCILYAGISISIILLLLYSINHFLYKTTFTHMLLYLFTSFLPWGVINRGGC